MIKNLAKTVVGEMRMSSAIESAEKYSDYLISLHEVSLLKHLANSKMYNAYGSKTITKINDELQFIKDSNSRDLLIAECSQLLLMNSLQEIL